VTESIHPTTGRPPDRHLPVAAVSNAVTHVRAVDPATVGRRLAAKRVASSSVPVRYVGLDGQALSDAEAHPDGIRATQPAN
jgi:hypothetical protein